jgi:hypothetical protein
MGKPRRCPGFSLVLENNGAETDAGTQNDQLWSRVTDHDTHLFLREPAIRKLARRRDSRMADFCEVLLKSGDPDEFLVAIDTLTQLGGNYAVTRLIGLCSHCLVRDRVIALGRLAQVVTSDRARPFTVMMKELIMPGEVETTGWTPLAREVLLGECRRRGLSVAFVHTGSSEEVAIIDSQHDGTRS